MIGIYKITSPSNKVYIGQSWDIERRIKMYKRLSCKKQIKLYSSFIKYGVDSHKFEIVVELNLETNQEKLNELEIFYWKEFINKGIEMLNLKEPGSNGKHSEESKRKMSIALTGKVYTEVRKKNMSNAQKKIFNSGTPEEIIERKKKAISNAKLTEELVKSIKLDVLNNVPSVEIKKKYNLTNNMFYKIKENLCWKHVIL
jgi:group I intron endonuclease